MNSNIRNAVALTLALLALGGISDAALAQYPSRPITIIVPYAPGGGDILVRELTKPLSDRLGQPVIVETRPGAGSALGSAYVANSDPDGYRILWNSSAAAINQTLQKSPTLDMRRDLAPITRAVNGMFALYASTTLPITNVRELIDYAKANPGKLNYGSSGIGGSMHLIMELVKSQAGLDIVHVPYQGGTPALAAAVVNEVQVLSYDSGLAAGQVQAGKLRIIGVLNATRSAAYPNVPPVADILPGVVVGYWWGFFAPAKTPQPILDRLHRDIVATLRQPDVETAFAKRNFTVAATPAEELARTVSTEVEQWTKVVRQANVPLQ